MFKEFIDPALMKLDSETWHTRAREALHLAEVTPFTLKLLEQFADNQQRFTDERLHGAYEDDRKKLFKIRSSLEKLVK